VARNPALRGGRATLAIAWQSLRRAAGSLDVLALAAGVGAAAEPAQAAPLSFLLGVVCAALSAVERPNVSDLTNLRYFAAPLYGRELARAHAIAALARVLGGGLTIALGLLVISRMGHAFSWPRLAVYLLAVLVAVLVASLGCLRTGRQRWLYVGFAVDSGLIVAALGFSATPLAVGAATLAAAALGFTALRALGETLARYDPLG